MIERYFIRITEDNLDVINLFRANSPLSYSKNEVELKDYQCLVVDIHPNMPSSISTTKLWQGSGIPTNAYAESLHPTKFVELDTNDFLVHVGMTSILEELKQAKTRELEGKVFNYVI